MCDGHAHAAAAAPLAERAKEIARGDYKQRVDESSPDEIGALGREFNAMAAALDEREQRLIRSERLAAVGKIAAQITHEVRNPLSSIGLNAEMLEEEVGALEGRRRPGAQQLARAIVKEVDRLTEITEEYLRFARLPRPKLEREDLRQIVASLLAFLRGELEARGVTVELQRRRRRCRRWPPTSTSCARRCSTCCATPARRWPAAARLGADAGAAATTAHRRARASATAAQGIAAEHLAKIFDPVLLDEGGRHRPRAGADAADRRRARRHAST